MDAKTNNNNQNDGKLKDKIKNISESGAAVLDSVKTLNKDKLILSLKPYIAYAGKGLFVSILAYLFCNATAAFSSIPFGFALLGSLEKYVFFAYAASVLSAILSRGMAIQLFIVYSAQMILRIMLAKLLSPKDKKPLYFKENIKLKLAGSTIMALLLSLYKIIQGGFLYYDIFSSLFTALSVPILCYLFSCCIDNSGSAKLHNLKYEAGVLSILFCLVYSLKNIMLFGFSLSLCFAFFITLSISKSCGALKGTLAGLVCGAACGTPKILAFSVCGFASGLLWVKGVVPAALCALATSIAASLYAEGLSSIYSFAPDILASTAIFIPISKYIKGSVLPIADNKGFLPKELEQNILKEEQKQKDTENKLLSLSKALSALSETFFMLSDKRKRPSQAEIRSMCEICFDKNCKKCRNNSDCWSKDYLSTNDFMNRLSNLLYTNGRAEKDDIPKYMLSRCPNMDSILEELNSANADLLQKCVCNNKTEIFAIDYEQMSKILAHAIIENDEEYEIDEILSQRVDKYLGYISFYASCINVCGKRKKTVHAYGVNTAKLKLSSDELRMRFERLCGVKFKNPCFSIDSDYVSMSMEADRVYKISSAKTGYAKDESNVSGDSIYMFDNKCDYFYSLLSDGMGSGKSAALSSQLTGLFLKKMLEAGNKKSISFEMLNHILREKGNESSATVDLLEVDLISGCASFTKSGAAPSFIIRNGRLFNISSNSMPMGITKEINAEEIKFNLQENDIIVMISDGIAPSFEDGIWVADLLSYELEKGESLQSIADKILLNASINKNRSDDMSVAVLQIEKI